MKQDRSPIRNMVLAFFCGLSAVGAQAEIIGEVDTAFRWLGKDDRVVIEAYDDPAPVA
jgi:CreA protein